MRVLVDALREGGIAPTAEAARHVERIGARSGRSLDSPQASSAAGARGAARRALAVLEQGDLLQAAQLAGLEDAEAADAADLLTTAGILESGRPLTFSPPDRPQRDLRRALRAERAQGHRRAARLLAEQPGTERARRQAPAGQRARRRRLGRRAAGRGRTRSAEAQGAPESEAVFLRRALAEPPPPGDRLGIAARPRNGRGERRARRLARAPAAGRRSRAGPGGSRRGSARAGARAQRRPALRGGGRSPRSRGGDA